MARMREGEYKWKEKFNSSDQVDGMGDQIGEFKAWQTPQLTGSPKGIQFIRKDETNRECCRKLFRDGRRCVTDIMEYW